LLEPITGKDVKMLSSLSSLFFLPGKCFPFSIPTPPRDPKQGRSLNPQDSDVIYFQREVEKKPDETAVPNSADNTTSVKLYNLSNF
jgi:hypothetical protein